MDDTKRNFGIDLFKIIAAFMIVCLHTMTQGGIIANLKDLTVKGEIFWLLETVFYVGVNCFAVISGYLGLNSSHKYSTLISLWLQVVFWSVVFNAGQIAVVIIRGGVPDYLGLVKSFFPILSQENWYFSAYFVMFFFTPLFDYLINTLNRKEIKKILLISVMLFCVIETISHDTVFAVNGGYSWVWLSVLYLFGAYYKKYAPFENISGGKALLGFVVCMLLTYASRLVIALATNIYFGEVRLATKFITYTSPFMLLGALCLLHFFKNIHLSERLQPSVRLITSLTFGVYIIHTCNVVYRNVLRNLFIWVAEYNIVVAILMFFACALAVFSICAILDWGRILLFRFIKIDKLTNSVGAKIENVFKYTHKGE